MISCATTPYSGKLYGDGFGGADDQDIWLLENVVREGVKYQPVSKK
jgi:hypothetical protein